MVGTLNRLALVLRYKQPFLDWLNNSEFQIGLTLNDLNSNTPVYLIKEFDDVEVFEKKGADIKNFIFSDVLYSWTTDMDSWPKDNGPQSFKKYFGYSLHETVTDSEDDPITINENLN